MKQAILFFVLMCFAVIHLMAQKEPKKTKVEQQEKICTDLAQADKPVLAIMPFKVGTQDLAIGTGVSDMLMNAVFGCGCFRIVERERLSDIMTEQGLGLSGAGDEASFAKVGKISGANVLVFGTITEFKENESGGGGGAGTILRRGPFGAILGGVGAKTSHLGYTLRFINPNTGEVLDMKSFDKQKTAVGVAAGGIFGGGIGGGGFYKSKSMQDALEESLIEAVTYMSQNKQAYAGIVTNSKNAVASALPQMNKESCSLLKLPHKPKFMVIIPEEHLTGKGSNYDPNRLDININNGKDGQQPSGSYNGGGGGSDNGNMQNAGTDAINKTRGMFRPPDPAGETEIAKRFLEYGFELIDSKQLEKLKADKEYANAFDNPLIAQQFALKYGADIIIVGEAFSEYAKQQTGMTSCRARVEVKAIMASNAQLLVTEGLEGSGLDISEIIAGKSALRAAGGKVADYFLAQLCNKSDAIASLMNASKGGVSVSSGGGISETTSELQFKNVDFNKATTVGKLLQSLKGVSKAERISFANSTARFTVSHTGDTNSLLEKISTVKSLIKLNILSSTGNSADIEVMN